MTAWVQGDVRRNCLPNVLDIERKFLGNVLYSTPKEIEELLKSHNLAGFSAENKGIACPRIVARMFSYIAEQENFDFLNNFIQQYNHLFDFSDLAMRVILLDLIECHSLKLTNSNLGIVIKGMITQSLKDGGNATKDEPKVIIDVLYRVHLEHKYHNFFQDHYIPIEAWESFVTKYTQSLPHPNQPTLEEKQLLDKILYLSKDNTTTPETQNLRKKALLRCLTDLFKKSH